MAKPRRGGDTAFDSTPSEQTSSDLRKQRHSLRIPRRSAPARSAGVATAFWSAVAKPRRGGDTAFDSTPSERTSNALRKRRHSLRIPRRSTPARPAGVASAFWSAVAKPRRGGDTAFDPTRLLTLTPRGQLQLELLHGAFNERVVLKIFADAGGTRCLHGCSFLSGGFWCRHRFRLGRRCGGWFGRG